MQQYFSSGKSKLYTQIKYVQKKKAQEGRVLFLKSEADQGGIGSGGRKGFRAQRGFNLKEVPNPQGLKLEGDPELRGPLEPLVVRD